MSKEFSNVDVIDNEVNNNSFIIGIGTSAGGLEALKTFFDNFTK